MSVETGKMTPMMMQWHACKEGAKEALLLFRMGDFYEAFYEDAELLSKELDLTLTKRQGIPMAGVPFHTLEGYVDKLVQKGFKVAIAEQVEDPREAKGLVRREIVRIVTPGTHIGSINEKTNNYFVALVQIGSLFGLSFLDLSTGEFKAVECESLAAVLQETYKLRPSEFLIPTKFFQRYKTIFEEMKLLFPFIVTEQEDWLFDHKMAYMTLIEHFRVHSLDAFGMQGMTAAVNAAGALLSFIRDTLSLQVSHLQVLSTYHTKDFMLIDRTSRENLELEALFSVLDKTKTPMGGRLLKQWMLQPLVKCQGIKERQDCVQEMQLFNIQGLMEIKDLERLMMRISSSTPSPRDFVALRHSLEKIPALKEALRACKSPLLVRAREQLYDMSLLTSHLAKALVENPPLRLSDGGIFKEGYSQELDALRCLKDSSTSWLAEYQMQLRAKTGIKTLKVSFTSAFGYFIEVSKGQAAHMPAHFQRRQTLVNSERFISPELKEYEEKVLTAEDRLLKLEAELFAELRFQVVQEQQKIFEIAQAVALIDVLVSLADVAHLHNYVRPEVDESLELVIVDGRHPVIEAALSKPFTSNDTQLDAHTSQLILLTGPNMAGKSTYIRQVALITLMAHMGSFVPAKRAHIGIVDKIFTRIGASDDLSRGQSTFMVEMSETANILHHATEKSLVILDEIGRGTSTYDGIAIAWSVAEYLIKNVRAKTLFATHYWELTQLEMRLKGAVNYNVAVQETHEGIYFLHKIVKGGTDKSYGIHVAKLAGLPHPVVDRAKEILSHLEGGKKERKKQVQDAFQMLLFHDV